MVPTALLPLVFSIISAVSNLAIEQGGQAPPFTVADCDGHLVDLRATLAQGPVVLAFFPKANTSGCTQEMQALVKGADMFKQYRTTVLAVSRDNAAKLQKFRKDLGASFTFVPDTEGELMRLYKSKLPLVNVAKRKTFVINQQGLIVHTAEGSDAIALKGVLEALKSMSAVPAPEHIAH